MVSAYRRSQRNSLIPYAAPKACSKHPKIVLNNGSKCTLCKKANRKRDRQRRTSTERGYNYRWQKARKIYLNAHPLCECNVCKAGEGVAREATVVDHIVPHRDNMQLFWDQSNWQALSKPCHDRKTFTDDGGFNRD